MKERSGSGRVQVYHAKYCNVTGTAGFSTGLTLLPKTSGLGRKKEKPSWP